MFFLLFSQDCSENNTRTTTVKRIFSDFEHTARFTSEDPQHEWRMPLQAVLTSTELESIYYKEINWKNDFCYVNKMSACLIDSYLHSRDTE